MTIVCGDRRLDVALPSSVPWVDLQPSLLRLMLPGDPPSSGGRWVAGPVGRTALQLTETLSSAGILIGDVLTLRQQQSQSNPADIVHTGRDRVEDVVHQRGWFWGPRASRRLALWVAIVTGAALLVPAASLPVGLPMAGWAATTAVMVAVTAVFSGRKSEMTCAAAGLVIGCGWAALAGAAAVHGLMAGRAGSPVVEQVVAAAMVAGRAGSPVVEQVVAAAMLAGAVGSALLLAACAAVSYPPALVHAAALLVAGGAAAAFAVAVTIGAPVPETACVAAVVAVIMIGGLPRVALAGSGLTGSAGIHDPPAFDRQIIRADRLLTGSVIGVSLISVTGAVPAALSGDGWLRLLDAGVGLLLLLRSRALSQVPHTLGPRIAAVLVFAELWVGLYRNDSPLQAELILCAAAGTAALALILSSSTVHATPVSRARAGRILDIMEQLLVVALVVLAAGTAGLVDWVSSVLG